MNPLRFSALLLVALLSACAWHADTDKRAHKFFDEGRDMILSALKRQDASEAQLKDARAILDRHEKTVPTEIAGVFRKQRAVLRGITSGQNSEQLATLDTDLHKTSDPALRSIGRMHEELAAAVGDKTWKAAAADLDKRMARHFRE
jgi:hypothetical protein